MYNTGAYIDTVFSHPAERDFMRLSLYMAEATPDGGLPDERFSREEPRTWTQDGDFRVGSYEGISRRELTTRFRANRLPQNENPQMKNLGKQRSARLQ